MLKEYSPRCLRETTQASYTTRWASEFMVPRLHESPKHCQSVSAASQCISSAHVLLRPFQTQGGWTRKSSCLPLPVCPLILCHCELQLFFSPNVALCGIISPSLLALPRLLITELEKPPTGVAWKFTSPWLPFVKSKSGLIREELTPDRGLDALIFPWQQSGLM